MKPSTSVLMKFLFLIVLVCSSAGVVREFLPVSARNSAFRAARVFESVAWAAEPQATEADAHPFPKMMRIIGSEAHFKFLHSKHEKTKVRTLECKDCHTMDADGVIETIPQHPQCVECHLQRTDVKPQMFQCAGCHVGYLFDDSRRTVSYAFTHKSHLINKKTGKAIKCEECHQLVRTSIERFDMTIPAVHECMQCHNGRDSFIVYDCSRCHNPITAPESHRLETMLPAAHTAPMNP